MKSGRAHLNVDPARPALRLPQVSDTPGKLTRTFLSSGHRRAAAVVSGAAGRAARVGCAGRLRIRLRHCRPAPGSSFFRQGGRGPPRLTPQHANNALACLNRLQIQRWMSEAGMTAWVDSIGNVHGRVESKNDDAPTQYVGSHYDTVVDGGKYDGAMGIIVGIAAVKALLLDVSDGSGVLLALACSCCCCPCCRRHRFLRCLTWSLALSLLWPVFAAFRFQGGCLLPACWHLAGAWGR